MRSQIKARSVNFRIYDKNCTIGVAKTKASVTERADLCLCFGIGNNPVFSQHDSYNSRFLSE